MTYCEKQMAASLVRCARCHRAWYMTVFYPLCIVCRRQAAKA
jgi:hypothetical protein